MINTVPMEKTIISTIMSDVKMIESVMDFLHTEHFFDEVCSELYGLALTAYLAKVPFDETFIISKFPDRQEDVIGIMTFTPIGRESIVKQAQLVIKTAKDRAIITNLDNAKATILAGKDYDFSSLLQVEMTQKLEIKSNKEIIHEMEEKINNPVKDHGVGLNDVDRFITIAPGSLCVLAARPSMGKTAMVITTILHLLKNGEGSLFFSLEMPRDTIMARAIANKADEDLSNIKKGQLKNYQAYKEAKDYLANTDDFMIVDTALDHNQIYNHATTILRRNPNIKNVFVDHIGYIKDPGGYQNTHLRIGDITKTFKRLAKEMNVKFWVLSQLSRSIESRPNKRPQLSDLRESGSIEEDGDLIIGLYRDSYYKVREEGTREESVNPAEVIVLKNRDGEVGIAHTKFVGPTVKFTDRVAAVETVYEYIPNEDDLKIELPIL